MSLTTAQETTLAAHIRASQDAAVIAALAIRNDVELARQAPAAGACVSRGRRVKRSPDRDVVDGVRAAP